MATKEKKQEPFDSVRLGHIVADIWRNVTDKGVRFNVKFCKLYRTDDRWKRCRSFGRDDLLLLAKVADKAHSRIYELQDLERSQDAEEDE